MSLNITSIKIENARKGTENMIKANILGRFTIDLYLEDSTHFLSLKDMTLRQTREGKKYIQHAYETWGPDNKKKFFHYLWPGMDNNNRDAKMADLLVKVTQQIDSADPTPKSSSAPSSGSTTPTANDGASLF